LSINDATLAITWPAAPFLLSQRDRGHPSLAEVLHRLPDFAEKTRAPRPVAPLGAPAAVDTGEI